MVPAFGVMIASYIVTRMLELLAGEGKTIIKVFGVITILGTIVSFVDIMNAGLRVPHV